MPAANVPRFLRSLVDRAFAKAGYRKPPSYDDMEPEFLRIYRRCRPFTMTSIERMHALYKAVEYIVLRGIPGDIVECGVWKGGSSMLAALSLLHFGDQDRRIFLFDTFRGMPQPGDLDVDMKGRAAAERWERMREGDASAWAKSPLAEVERNMATTGYPAERLVLVEGMVEDTLPRSAPEAIALLRLDTDWYESTGHELLHLYPRLSAGGVLIVDDYGHWQGARRAVDEFLRERGMPLLLNRIDYTGRIGVKPTDPLG